MSQPNLNKLLARASLADRKGFQLLYQYSSAKLYAIALRITRQEKLAEDVLQEGFIKIWQNASHFDPQKAQAMTWMGTIIRNQAIDLLRQQLKHTDIDVLDETSLDVNNAANPTEDSVIQGDNQQVIQQCLQTLDEKYRTAILLAYLDGYSHQEIADKQGLTISNVKNRIHRGVAMVKNCVQVTFAPAQEHSERHNEKNY